ncbi:FecR family protein [Rubrivivax sp. RP6-9]|uniref:FecR family protein n=1 Tax=Rubrivivax sp. RP6-9 TaxID=3415750 RepID=UPI003CC60CE4
MGQPRAAAADNGEPDLPVRVPPEIAAEAAVWVTRLHGPQRSRRMEQECLAWQQRSAAHREAFERCTDTWESVPRVTLASAYVASKSQTGAEDRGTWYLAPVRWASTVAVVLAVVTGALGYQHWRDVGVYTTGVGEQQIVMLDDGTRMTLNTDTRVRVDLGSRQRAVAITSGEALFEVAKDPLRPFVVHAGGSEVVAIGTVFAVRFAGQGGAGREALAVTLIEGQVAVQAAAGTSGLAPARTVRLVAGDRVRLSGSELGQAPSAEAELDRPNLEQVVAWKRSEVVFDDASLPEAVAEMNRYSRTAITLLQPSSLADLRVSGLYRTGDTAGFASAVAALHGLQVRQGDGRLELIKPH